MDKNYYKKKLEEELELLEKELKTVGTINPDNKADWETVGDPETNENDDHSDPNDNADDQEEFGERQAILRDLEIRFNNVKEALQRIDDDTFGKCDICEKEIEEKRLEANPAATTCIEHTK